MCVYKICVCVYEYNVIPTANTKNTVQKKRLKAPIGKSHENSSSSSNQKKKKK